jgi:hypothetical protein
MPVIIKLFSHAQKHLALFWRLGNGTEMPDGKSVRRYLEFFFGWGGGGAVKISEEIRSVELEVLWDLFPEPHRFTSVRKAQVGVIFFFAK